MQLEQRETPSRPLYELYPNMEMPVLQADGKSYIGVLDIPALGLSLPVMSQWSYPNLKLAPCRYTGSAYSGNLILAGHNYPSHFGGLQAASPPLTATSLFTRWRSGRCWTAPQWRR